MSPPPFLPTVCLQQIGGSERERRKRSFPSHCTKCYPDDPLSMLTPASPQAPVNKAYIIGFAIIVSSTHLLCPSVHFTELELPAATLEEKKRRGMGNGACMALASPPDPRIQSEATNTQRCEVSCLIQNAGLSLQCHQGCWWGGRLERASALELVSGLGIPPLPLNMT